MPRARRLHDALLAAQLPISRRASLPRRVVREPPYAPMRPCATPQAPLTPVHKLPRPSDQPVEPPAPAWP